MSSPARRHRPRAAVVAAAVAAPAIVAGALTAQTPAAAVDRTRVLAAMRRATVFMVEKVSTRGGYVWAYLPDLSRRWGEIEARAHDNLIQPPGTATMGHIFLDAYPRDRRRGLLRVPPKASPAP